MTPASRSKLSTVVQVGLALVMGGALVLFSVAAVDVALTNVGEGGIVPVGAGSAEKPISIARSPDTNRSDGSAPASRPQTGQPGSGAEPRPGRATAGQDSEA